MKSGKINKTGVEIGEIRREKMKGMIKNDGAPRGQGWTGRNGGRGKELDD